jgi:hypothetical protein
MQLIAHIGNVPVEETLPFLVPIVALYVYGRRRERRRRDAVRDLPAAGEPLNDDTVARVLAAWSAADHRDVSREHLPVLYPPGPDGMSASELAERGGCEPASVELLLEELADMEYLELEHREGFPERRAWLTFKGYELVHATETALLSAIDHTSAGKPSS